LLNAVVVCKAIAIVFVFDPHWRSSWDDVLRRHAAACRVRSATQVPSILVATKMDLFDRREIGNRLRPDRSALLTCISHHLVKDLAELVVEYYWSPIEGVSREEAEEFCRKKGVFTYIETSAKNQSVEPLTSALTKLGADGESKRLEGNESAIQPREPQEKRGASAESCSHRQGA